RQMAGHDVAAAAEIDQPDFRPVADDDPAIRPLEGGTGDDARLPLAALAVDPGRHALEPRLAIRIGQRDPGMHLGDVGIGLESVAFLERPTETRLEVLGNGRLARPRNTHEHQDLRRAGMAACAVETMDALAVGDE